MEIVAHRGTRGLAPENTMRGIRKAKELGLKWVEVDVRVTRDGIPILFHDEYMARMTGLRKKVREAEWAEIRRYRVCGEEITRLEDALREDINFVVEVKEVEDVERVMEVVEEVRAKRGVLLTSYHEEALLKTKEWGYPVGIIFHTPYDFLRAKDLGFDFIVPLYVLLTQKSVSFAHRLGLKVLAWTVNEREDFERMQEWGVDMVATDYPDRLLF